MISVRGRGPARLAAAAIATGMLAAGAIAGAGNAVADENDQQPGGATATLGGLKTFDSAVIHGRDGDKKIGAGLFEMAVDGGGVLKTYCIDIHTGTRKDAKYKEASWAESSLHSNENAGKILWILKNSYPQVNDLAALASKVGEGVKLTEKTAAAGTQVAIWRFSDGANVEAVDPSAEKLADYLEKSAQNLAEPKASLTLDPPAVSGKAGEKLGPITVHTNAQTVTVAPSAQAENAGVKVVGEDGNPVTAAKNGDKLFFDVPEGTEDGSASLTLQANTEVSVGRAFTSIDRRNPSQTQILAGSSESSVTATATATWATEAPAPAVTAEKKCVEGGVEVSVVNKGTEPFTFALAGEEHEVPADGKPVSVLVPVKEDQPYKITITGPNGFEKTFEGTLDCETASEVTTGGNGGGEESPKPSTEPSPATVGGDTGDTDGNLAETGSDSSTPIIAGVAIALVLLGGAAVFFLRKRKPTTAGSGD